MKTLLFSIFLLSALQFFTQDLHVVNLREEWFNSMHLTTTEKPLVATFPKNTINKQQLCALEPDLHCFTEYNWDDLVVSTRGKRVLVLIHGMAKDWSIANKDFFNMYWAAQRNLDRYDMVIGISWPGDSHIGPNSYVVANRLAKESGKFMRPFFKEITESASEVNVITHSMGSKVICWGTRGTEVQFDNIVLMAPSILRNKLKPMRRWHELFNHSTNKIIVAYSNQDLAFAWTKIQHVGMGYDGMNVRSEKRYPNLVQIDCTSTINQHVFMQLPREPFRSRSNHSSYCQSDPVFNAIQDILSMPPNPEALRLSLKSVDFQSKSVKPTP